MKEIKNKNKLKLIEDTNLLIDEEFGNIEPEEIIHERLSLFMGKINSVIQEYAHNVVKRKGTTSHVERKLVKHTAKLMVLKELGNKYPEQVVEFLFRKSYKVKFKNNERR